MKYEPVNNLADVMVGLVLNRKEANPTFSHVYDYKALTLRSLNSEGWIDKTLLDDFKSIENLDKKYLGQVGDVLVKITPPYTAVAITKDLYGVVIPSQFIIIRVNNKAIVPEYLAFYLNADQIKKEIMLSATGSMVAMLRTNMIRLLRIPIPNIEKQLKISKLSKLIIEEKHLMNKMVVTKEKYYQALTKSLIKEDM